MSQMDLRDAMSELEQADRAAEHCRLAWLVGQTAHASAIDPYLSEAYCIAANTAAEARVRYVDVLTQAQSEYLKGDMEATA